MRSSLSSKQDRKLQGCTERPNDESSSAVTTNGHRVGDTTIMVGGELLISLWIGATRE